MEICVQLGAHRVRQRFGLWLEAIPKRELGTSAAPYFVSHPASPFAPLQHRASKWWRLTPFVYSVLASLVLTNPSPSARQLSFELKRRFFIQSFRLLYCKLLFHYFCFTLIKNIFVIIKPITINNFDWRKFLWVSFQ